MSICSKSFSRPRQRAGANTRGDGIADEAAVSAPMRGDPREEFVLALVEYLLWL